MVSVHLREGQGMHTLIQLRHCSCPVWHHMPCKVLIGSRGVSGLLQYSVG